MPDPTRERRRVVSSQCPESATGGDVAANTSYQGGQECDNQKPQSTASGSSSLPVDLSQRETKNTIQDSIEVLNRVEHGDHVEKSGDESNRHLGQHGFRDVSAWTMRKHQN